jgi:ATP-dependent Clp protease ATP-binding subunit ClpC
MGYDPEMGARPLRRVIQAKIEDTLSDGMLSGEFKDGDEVQVQAIDKDVKLVVQPRRGPSVSEAPEAPEALPAL